MNQAYGTKSIDKPGQYDICYFNNIDRPFHLFNIQKWLKATSHFLQISTIYANDRPDRGMEIEYMFSTKFFAVWFELDHWDRQTDGQADHFLAPSVHHCNIKSKCFQNKIWNISKILDTKNRIIEIHVDVNV